MDITGQWYNELGSTLLIQEVQNGYVQGIYSTAVSSQGCAQGDFSVVGVTDTDSGGQAVAFSVVWNNDQSSCKSVTAWSGQVVDDQISAFWLLTLETDPTQNWQSTMIGQDVFTRSQPQAEDIATKQRLLRRSHP